MREATYNFFLFLWCGGKLTFSIHDLLSQGVGCNFQHLLDPPEEDDVVAVDHLLSKRKGISFKFQLHNMCYGVMLIRHLIFEPLMVHPVAFAALVSPGEALTKEVTSVNMMPRLSDELVLHFHSICLKIAAGGCQLFVRQRGWMILCGGDA